MPADLKLLPRQQFTITFSDGSELTGQFGTYATSLYGKRKNLSLSEIMKNFIIEQKDEKGEVIKNDKGESMYDVRLHDMIEYVMCALESRARERGDRFNLTDPQLCKWVDDYYYDTGIPNVLITLYSHSIMQGEKKSQTELQATS